MKWQLTFVILLLPLAECLAQADVNVLARRFNSYHDAPARTRIHLIFNQPVYSPGDTAFFKGYFLTHQLNKVEGKQLLHFNLVDAEGKSRLHFMFYSIDGNAQNQFVVPATIPPGIYLVTAHSNWAKEVDEIGFKKELRIVARNKVLVSEEKLIAVHPEGGHLIAGIPNHVIINTRRLGATVAIVNSSGNEVVRAVTNELGNASAMFTPVANETYVAVAGSSKTKLNVEADGCGIVLQSRGDQSTYTLKVVFPSNSSLRNRELMMLVSARGKIVHTANFRGGSEPYSEILIPSDNLPAGLATISILDKTSQPVATRHFYHSSTDIVNAAIQTAKKTWLTREKVSVNIQLTDAMGQPLEGEFSIGVTNAALFDNQLRNTFADELNVAAITNDFVINRSNPNWAVALDHFLITVAEEISWKKITSETGHNFAFINWIQRHGTVYVGDSLQPAPDNTKVMFYLQEDTWHYQTFTLNNGRFVLNLPDVYGTDEFFYVVESRKGKPVSTIKITWDDKIISLPRAVPSEENDLPDAYATFMTRKRVIDHSFAFFATATQPDVEVSDRVTFFEDEIMGADVTVDAQRYTMFSTMAEMIREVIPSMFHRKVGGKHSVYVNLPEPFMANATGSPVYIIDGTATSNTDFFLSLKPSEILTVKIIKSIKKLQPFGIMGKNGIVIVHTRRGDARELLDDPAKVIEGLSRPATFNMIEHSATRDPHHPDFRSTIYWNPTVKTNASGKATVDFYCSDDVGKQIIQVDGITSDGKAFSATSTIEVAIEPIKE
jgi:hypothetical protein